MNISTKDKFVSLQSLIKHRLVTHTMGKMIVLIFLITFVWRLGALFVFEDKCRSSCIEDNLYLSFYLFIGGLAVLVSIIILDCFEQIKVVMTVNGNELLIGKNKINPQDIYKLILTDDHRLILHTREEKGNTYFMLFFLTLHEWDEVYKIIHLGNPLIEGRIYYKKIKQWGLFREVLIKPDDIPRLEIWKNFK